MKAGGYSMKLYFPHIEGLRFIAALLVAIYHIWTDRISGGVDVFFVISGLLVTLSLMRQVEKNGRLDIPNFFTGLSLRLLPAAMLVLTFVLIGTFLILPATQHLDTVREIFASLLYYENWQLAAKAIDYLDRENPPSPVQHFWAMSVQGQFYIYAVFLLLISSVLHKHDRGIARNVLILNGAAILLSFSYSIYQTYFGDQIWAYFDTFARVWEFGLGSMLAIFLTRRPRASLPPLLGWAGFMAIIFCGLIFNVASAFPGAAALFPTIAAILVVLGGRSQSRWSIHAVLGNPAMISLGSVSYGVYLFHWPLLVFYQEITGYRPKIIAGIGIILISIGLAYLVRNAIERPMLRLKSTDALRAKLRTSIICFVPVLASITAVYVGLTHLAVRNLNDTHLISGIRPLTLRSAEEIKAKPESYKLSPDLAKRDVPEIYKDRCYTSLKSDVAVWCTYGEKENFVRTLAVMGGSHTAHWLPALLLIAEEHDWRVLVSIWDGCRFIIDQDSERCGKLAREGLQKLNELKPDLLFTSGSATLEKSPQRRFVTWRAIQELNIQIVSPRGTPRFRINVPECLAKNDNYLTCGKARAEVLSGIFDVTGTPENAHVFDLSEYFCDEKFCPPVVDGIILYSDGSHITKSYAIALKNVIEKNILPFMGGAPKDQNFTN